MGARSDEDSAGADERPRHQVEITQSFWVSSYLVTQSLFEEVMGKNPSKYLETAPENQNSRAQAAHAIEQEAGM